jgi:hypothetical protein
LFLIFVSHVRDRFLARFHTFASALVSFCEWVTSRIGCPVLDSGAPSYPDGDWHQSARPRHATFLGIVRQVKVRGASLKATEQPIDTATAARKCFSTCWASSLNFGTDPRGGRLEGIAEAKGVYRAGRPRANANAVREMKGGASAVAKARRSRPSIGMNFSTRFGLC